MPRRPSTKPTFPALNTRAPATFHRAAPSPLHASVTTPNPGAPPMQLLSPMAAATGHTSAFHNTPLAKQLMTPKNTTPKPLATPTGHFFYDQPSLPALSPTLVTPATPATPAPPQFPLHLACRKNNKAAALDLIASAPELIQTTDANGMLPLHHAAIRCAHLSIIEALVIPFRASIFATDAAGKTPLNYADQYFASEATLIALNDKRRKLRDDKVREAAEAERERVRCLEEEAAKLAEDDKRETVEVLERELEELVDVGAQFLDAVDPIKISAPTTIMPFPNEQLTRVETTLAALSVVVAAKTSHPDRLEAFLKVANVGPVELNSAVRKWATKVRRVARTTRRANGRWGAIRSRRAYTPRKMADLPLLPSLTLAWLVSSRTLSRITTRSRATTPSRSCSCSLGWTIRLGTRRGGARWRSSGLC